MPEQKKAKTPAKAKAAAPKCEAAKRGGGLCGRPAGWGTQHLGVGKCKLHGGATPNHELAGAVILARREMAVMGQPLDIEPGEALLQCIRIAAGEVQYASDRIGALDEADAIVQASSTKTRPLSHGKDGESASETVEEVTTSNVYELNIWIQVRRQALDRLVNYSAVALKAGVEERRVRVAEQTGVLIAQAIRGVLAELGVADRPEVPSVVRRQLALVSGQAA